MEYAKVFFMFFSKQISTYEIMSVKFSFAHNINHSSIILKASNDIMQCIFTFLQNDSAWKLSRLAARELRVYQVTESVL